MGAARDENERIDLIAGDPEIFEGGTQRPISRWRQLGTIGGLVAIVTVAAVALWPSSEPKWRVFKPAPVPVTGLTDELVFDQPSGPLVYVNLPPPPTGVRPELGYVFGEPDGTLLTRRWAAFRTRTSSLQSAPESAGLASVNGVAANVKRVRVRHNVEWGPVDGRTWVVTTNKFTESEALEFANQVGLVDGLPALAHQYELGEMVPVGSIAAFDCVVLLADLFHDERGQGTAQPTLLTWGTLEDSISLGSIAAPSDALPLVEFVLGAGRPTAVHGQPAVMITSRVLAGPVIGWVEDGRLILVTGDLAEIDLLVVAESVRPATSGEWRIVERADATR